MLEIKYEKKNCAANPRILFTFKPLLTLSCKDPKSNLIKITVTYSCCCNESYIGSTTGHLRKRMKERVLKTVDKFCLSNKKDNISIKVYKHLNGNPL